MPTNPGERFPFPSIPERAVRGTILFFNPILDALLIGLAIGLVFAGLPLVGVVVALVAGRISGVR